MNFCGFLWIPMESDGFILIPLDSYGSLWIPMDSYGLLLIHVGSCGRLRRREQLVIFGITVRDITGGAGGVRYSVVGHPLGWPKKKQQF